MQQKNPAEAQIREWVHHFYWDQDLNCARTTLSCLSRLSNVSLEPQTLQAAIGMHGAGRFRAQCGLVEGTLMFLGIHYAQQGKSDQEISRLCFAFAEVFTERFSSLRCSELRPHGFTPEDPPHLCEALSVDAILFAWTFIQKADGTRL